MATDFTQDAVLHFLQSCGGSVKNSDLLLHFRTFIRDHPDRNRNREQFKKFVNSVATVKQIDGVSFVVLRKKFKGHVPGSGAGSSPEPPRPTAGKNTELSPESARLSPAWSAEKPRQKAPQREVAAAAPPGVSAQKTILPAEKTILPAAGIILNNNNNNVETNLNLKQVSSAPELSGRAAAAPQVKPPSVSEPPAPVQCTKVGQQRVEFVPPPVAPAVRHHVEPSQQVQEPLTGRQPDRSLHQEPSLQLQDAPRRIRHRKSYKSAVSYDEDEDEEEQVVEVQVKGGSAGGARPLSAPLRDAEKVMPASLPGSTATPAPPSGSSSSSATSSSERQLPKIFVQDVDVEMMPPGGSWGSGVGHRGQWAAPGLQSSPTRRSVPLDAERCAEDVAPHRYVQADRPYSQPAAVQLKPNQGPDQSQGAGLSSSHSSVLSHSSDTGFSSGDWPPSGSPGGLRRNSSYEDLLAVTGKPRGRSQIQDVLQRAQESVMHRATVKTTAPWHHSTGNLLDVQESTARLPPFHRSTDHLHDDQGSTARVVPWHLSTDDLSNDREDAESSEGSTSSPRLRPWVARRVSSQLRSRMCRSLGADLDQLLQEQARAAGGSEAARLNRLHLISSTLSLRYNLSSSSLSSCSTPSRSQSFAELVERVEGKGGRRSLPTAVSTTGHQEGTGRQSLVPLEPREHAWLVKGAAGAWPDIYSLFREDTSLLNRQDFISGFTVLHWIAKHGDHRVLNTLWYGVQKAGLTFDMNTKSACGHTPLHIAAMHGHRNMMRLLVNKFDADVKLRDTAGKRPWQYLSRSEPPDVFQLLGAPPRRPAGGGDKKEDSSWEQPQPQQQRRRRRRHHLSFASSGERPVTISGTMRVKRSSSIAAFLKHKSLLRFQGVSEPST